MITDEHVRDYIESLSEGLPEDLFRLEREALAAGVPIIRDDAISLLRSLLRVRRPKRILEIGTAVGFSALVMSEYAKDAQIVTIEKVPMRLIEAKKNLKDSKNITLLVGDANDVCRYLSGDSDKEPSEVYANGRTFTLDDYKSEYEGGVFKGRDEGGLKYDFVFMDAAKGQYMKFLEPIVKMMDSGSMLVTDNVLSEGLLAQSKYAVERRDRTIHMRMREYLYHLTHCDEFETQILPLADGMSISVKR